MTGGFYDYRRSKLKFMNVIMQNTMSIHKKEEELKGIGSELQNILFFLCSLRFNAILFVAFSQFYMHQGVNFFFEFRFWCLYVCLVSNGKF